nr:hypothetical protein [Parachlamydiaceae bacterium]
QQGSLPFLSSSNQRSSFRTREVADSALRLTGVATIGVEPLISLKEKRKISIDPQASFSNKKTRARPAQGKRKKTFDIESSSLEKKMTTSSTFALSLSQGKKRKNTVNSESLVLQPRNKSKPPILSLKTELEGNRLKEKRKIVQTHFNNVGKQRDEVVEELVDTLSLLILKCDMNIQNPFKISDLANSALGQSSEQKTVESNVPRTIQEKRKFFGPFSKENKAPPNVMPFGVQSTLR